MTPKRKNPLQFNKTKPGKPDLIILIFFIAMLIFGSIMIFDASVYISDTVYGDPYHFLTLHLIWLMIGLIPTLVIYFWDYRKFSKLALPALIGGIVLLVAVLVMAEVTNGSRRWLRLGHDQLVIQPAELMKPIFIIYISTWLAKERKQYKSFKDAFKYGFGKKILGFGAILLLVLGLILVEPDLGTTLVIGFTALVIFFVSGTDLAHQVGAMMVGGVFALIGVIAAILAPYRLDRVKTYLQLLMSGEVAEPTGAGYQIQQILIGIGSAGFLGKGFGQSRQRYGYLVELTAFTDSIYAVILEELGMLGGIIFLLAWLVFFSAGMRVARNAPDRQGKYMAIGITVWLTMQALFNMAANVALIPLTGIPLPFITYGGSSTIVAMIGMAILLNISRFSTKSNSRS